MDEAVKKWFSDKAKKYWAGKSMAERSDWARRTRPHNPWAKKTKEQMLAQSIRMNKAKALKKAIREELKKQDLI